MLDLVRVLLVLADVARRLRSVLAARLVALVPRDIDVVLVQLVTGGGVNKGWVGRRLRADVVHILGYARSRFAPRASPLASLCRYVTLTC